MLPKLDTFVLLTNEGPSLEKDEHWSKNKHGDDAMLMRTSIQLLHPQPLLLYILDQLLELVHAN